MIEGSRIDVAAHDNDAAAQVQETLQYNNMIQAVKMFVDSYHGEAVMLSVSDHETGKCALPTRQAGSLWEDRLIQMYIPSTAGTREF